MIDIHIIEESEIQTIEWATKELKRLRARVTELEAALKLIDPNDPEAKYFFGVEGLAIIQSVLAGEKGAGP